jgi:putative FmdB family regulatory protein
MPTYEFRCPLGHEFERFYRSIGTSEAQTACPVCGQISERFMSVGAGLVFKGSGFYLTDYGKNAHLKKAPTDGKSDGVGSEGAGGDGSKGEGAKNDGAKAETGSSGSGGDSSAGSTKPASNESKKADAKPAESKPAKPKPSAGE